LHLIPSNPNFGALEHFYPITGKLPGPSLGVANEEKVVHYGPS